MLLVVVNGYVSEENPSKNAFVHSRVLGYLDSGIPTRVFVVQKNVKSRNMSTKMSMSIRGHQMISQK